jgi:hypothetical protein
LKELLAGLLHGIAVKTEAWPEYDKDLQPFMEEFQNLLQPEAEVVGDGCEDYVMDVVAEVCCTYFSLLEKSERFRDYCEAHPKLSWAMLRYAGSRKTNTLY